MTLRDGGSGMAWIVPGQESFGHVTLRRGMTTTFDLWDWWARVRRDPAVRAICDVIVLTPDLAAERVRFRLHGCLPVKLTGPTLDAMGNDIAIESLELACDGIDIVSPGDKAVEPAPTAVAKVQLRELDRASSARSTRVAGSRRRSTPTSCGRRSATSSAPRPGWTCAWPSTSARRWPEAAGRPTTSAG